MKHVRQRKTSRQVHLTRVGCVLGALRDFSAFCGVRDSSAPTRSPPHRYDMICN